MYTPIFEQVPVSGQVFEVIAATDVCTPDGSLRYSKGTIVDTIAIENGRGESKQLYLGDYLVREKSAGEPFVKDPTEYPVSLEYEGETVPVVHSELSIENKRQQVEIELEKQMETAVDAPENFSPCADVLFGLYAGEDILDVSGEVIIPKDSLIALLPVGGDGKAGFNGKLPFAKMYAKELKTNLYYELNTNKYELEIAYQGDTVQTATIKLDQKIPNELKQAQLIIYKQGELLVGATQHEQDGQTVYQPIYEMTKLSGVTFDIVADQDIYDISGNLLYAKDTVVDTVTTGSDGMAKSRLLHLAKYRIIETSVPAGIVIDKTPKQVTLGISGEVTEVISHTISIDNQRQKAEIDLNKICEIPDNALEDFNPYEDIVFGIYANEDILSVDGSIAIPKDALLELVGVDESGRGALQSDLPIASYYAKELSCMDGYQLSEDKLEFAFEYQGPDADVVKLHVSEENIENRLQRGSLKIIKTFEGRETPIEGVPFRVVGTTTVGTDVVIEAQTDAKGEILLEGLLVGDYHIQELECDLTEGYVLSEEQAVVVASEQVAELTIENKMQRGDLKVIKTFEGKEKPIAGVPFRISGVSLLGVPYEEILETDEAGIISVEGLPVGEYQIEELSSDRTEGYLLSETQTIEVEHLTTAEAVIENELIRGHVKLIKTGDGGERLEGVTFELYNPEGELLGEYATDKNGEIFVEDLPYGKGYKWVEIEALDGYTVGSAIVFDITENDMTTEVSAVNSKIPQTGDSGVGTYVGLLMLSAGALAIACRFGKRKKS